MNKKILYSSVIILFLLFSTFGSQGVKITSFENYSKFYLWAISDTHGATCWDDDVEFDGTSWSGKLIDEGIERIDYAFIAGDILLNGGKSQDYSNYLNKTVSCLQSNRDMNSFWNAPADQRIMGFCIGNHEEYSDGCTAAAKGIGLDSSGNWYNNDIVMGNSYNYVVLRGNLLFVYMGGDRSDPNDYSYNLPTPADFYWLRTQVEWADNNQVNVIIVTHTSIFNSTISYTLPFGYSNHDVFYDITEGKWKNCEEHTRYNCDFDDPWPGDNHWTECDDYWDLIENYGNINLWFSGHVHTSNDERGSPPHKHAGWDTTLGVERDIQKSEYCTFVNCGAVFAWGMPWSFSRILTFTEGSKSVDFKSYDHEEHCYGHDTGWKSSHQDIMITSCLKYPFDPYFNPSNNAPNKPNKPEGETKGKKGAEYEYSSKTFDPENDQIYYLFRWSDGTDSGWLGPYDSGEGCSASHTWDEDGAYIVRVKSKDVHGSESVWSNPLNVMMPKPKSFPHIFYLKLSNYFQKIEKVVKKVNQII